MCDVVLDVWVGVVCLTGEIVFFIMICLGDRSNQTLNSLRAALFQNLGEFVDLLCEDWVLRGSQCRFYHVRHQVIEEVGDICLLYSSSSLFTTSEVEDGCNFIQGFGFYWIRY